MEFSPHSLGRKMRSRSHKPSMHMFHEDERLHKDTPFPLQAGPGPWELIWFCAVPVMVWQKHTCVHVMCVIIVPAVVPVFNFQDLMCVCKGSGESSFPPLLDTSFPESLLSILAYFSPFIVIILFMILIENLFTWTKFKRTKECVTFSPNPMSLSRGITSRDSVSTCVCLFYYVYYRWYVCCVDLPSCP